MTRHLRLAILTLLVASLPALAVLPAAGQEPTEDTTSDAGPRVVIDEPVVDAGRVPVGQTIEAEFSLRNEGTETLEITQVKPACGCTVAEFDKEIAPGATGKVHASVDTSRIAGPNAKAITVYTNDQATPRLQLTIKSEVRPYLVAQPGYARFTSMVHGDRDQKANQLLLADDFEDLEIVGVKSPRPWIEVTYREATEAEREPKISGRQWHVEVTAKSDAPPGPVADYIKIETNHPVQKVLELPVSGFVRPMIAVTPQDVNFGSVDPGEEQSWGILVRNFGSGAMKLETLENTVPGMKVDVEPIEPGRQYKIVFQPTTEMAKGQFSGHVALSTNLAQEEKITVKLTGEVR